MAKNLHKIMECGGNKQYTETKLDCCFNIHKAPGRPNLLGSFFNTYLFLDSYLTWFLHINMEFLNQFLTHFLIR